MANKRRITVIGGGVGGYPAAIRAARLGADVTIIEKADMGGTCLNRGCIPTKSLLQSAEVARTVKESEIFGVMSEPPKIDFGAVMKRKNKVVKQLRTGVEGLVKAKKIKLVRGEAKIVNAKTVMVGKEKIESDALIIATGSVPSTVPIPGLDKVDAWDSTDFLDAKALPKSVIIIGGGVIGVEVAEVMVGMGSQVTVLEMLPQIAPGVDTEVANMLAGSLAKKGIAIFTQAQVTKVEKKKGKKAVTYKLGKETKTVEADEIVVAVGRRPYTDGLDVEKLKLKMDRGAIVVNDKMETTVKDVYAVGDVTGGILLAHVAAAEGEVAAVNATGGDRKVSYKAVPGCIYTHPEVASVGLTEAEAKEQKYDVQVGKFPFVGVGKALVLDSTEGMVKIVADKKYGEVLGVHMIGPHATDMIAEAVLGIHMEATVEEFAHAIHPHPTLSEAVMEAALTLAGGAIHMP
ncbi:MAG: dihydrolipoyl dehydrogenase [Proteobacteria bacterium]|nr:dihydrolipoyl dehydrogenase [Pseudomonadota bacterium]